MRRLSFRRRLWCVTGIALLCACTSQRESTTEAAQRIDTARRFRSLLAAAQFDSAQTFLAPDARRWWGERQGDGSPWSVSAANPGPWAAWDAHFRSRKEEVSWSTEGNAVVLVQRETNDYFQLLDRGWVSNEIRYFFDTTGRIDGLLIRAIGERPPGRTQEFLAWARQNDPAELDALMDGDEVDPSGDHPQRFRALINRWRRNVGLEPIE
jgi:hypothetical protein